MKKLLKLLAAAAVSASLTTGFAAAQSGSINNTGPDSTNTINNDTTNSATVDNSNDAGVLNFNGQLATSGDAHANNNTTAGNVRSGNVSNSNSSSTNVSTSNSAGGSWNMGGDSQSASIDKTGPDSTNRVNNTMSNDLTVDNTNTVGVANINLQGAFSGDAHANNNTTAGDVVSGDASNSNNVSTSVSASNSL